MAMAHDGLAKLAEELGELQQVVGKTLAYGKGEHPDGGKPLIERFEDETADVIASIVFTCNVLGVDDAKVTLRSEQKLRLFIEWHQQHN